MFSSKYVTIGKNIMLAAAFSTLIISCVQINVLCDIIRNHNNLSTRIHGFSPFWSQVIGF